MNYTEKNRLLDKISVIGLMLIGFELFLYAADYCYTKSFDTAPKMPTILNVCGIIFLIVSVGMYIYAYKKSSKSIAVYDIEFLAFAFICPLITYWYYPKAFGLSTNWFHKVSHYVLWLSVLGYYVIKTIVVIYYSFKNSSSNKINKKLNKKKAS